MSDKVMQPQLNQDREIVEHFLRRAGYFELHDPLSGVGSPGPYKQSGCAPFLCGGMAAMTPQSCGEMLMAAFDMLAKMGGSRYLCLAAALHRTYGTAKSEIPPSGKNRLLILQQFGHQTELLVWLCYIANRPRDIETGILFNRFKPNSSPIRVPPNSVRDLRLIEAVHRAVKAKYAQSTPVDTKSEIFKTWGNFVRTQSLKFVCSLPLNAQPETFRCMRLSVARANKASGFSTPGSAFVDIDVPLLHIPCTESASLETSDLKIDYEYMTKAFRKLLFLDSVGVGTSSSEFEVVFIFSGEYGWGMSFCPVRMLAKYTHSRCCDPSTSSRLKIEIIAVDKKGRHFGAPYGNVNEYQGETDKREGTSAINNPNPPSISMASLFSEYISLEANPTEISAVLGSQSATQSMLKSIMQRGYAVIRVDEEEQAIIKKSYAAMIRFVFTNKTPPSVISRLRESFDGHRYVGWSADKRGREWLQLRRGCEAEDYASKMLSTSGGFGDPLAGTADSDLVAAILGSSMKIREENMTDVPVLKLPIAIQELGSKSRETTTTDDLVLSVSDAATSVAKEEEKYSSLELEQLELLAVNELMTITQSSVLLEDRASMLLKLICGAIGMGPDAAQLLLDPPHGGAGDPAVFGLQSIRSMSAKSQRLNSTSSFAVTSVGAANCNHESSPRDSYSPKAGNFSPRSSFYSVFSGIGNDSPRTSMRGDESPRGSERGDGASICDAYEKHVVSSKTSKYGSNVHRVYIYSDEHPARTAQAATQAALAKAAAEAARVHRAEQDDTDVDADAALPADVSPPLPTLPLIPDDADLVTRASYAASTLHTDMGLLTLSPPSTRPALRLVDRFTLQEIPVEKYLAPNEWLVWPGATLSYITGGVLQAPLHYVPYTLAPKSKIQIRREEKEKQWLEREEFSKEDKAVVQLDNDIKQVDSFDEGSRDEADNSTKGGSAVLADSCDVAAEDPQSASSTNADENIAVGDQQLQSATTDSLVVSSGCDADPQQIELIDAEKVELTAVTNSKERVLVDDEYKNNMGEEDDETRVEQDGNQFEGKEGRNIEATSRARNIGKGRQEEDENLANDNEGDEEEDEEDEEEEMSRLRLSMPMFLRAHPRSMLSPPIAVAGSGSPTARKESKRNKKNSAAASAAEGAAGVVLTPPPVEIPPPVLQYSRESITGLSCEQFLAMHVNSLTRPWASTSTGTDY